MTLDRVRLSGGGRIFPEEYTSAEDAMRMGDARLSAGDVKEADNYFGLALTKGKLLESELAAEQRRQQEENVRLAEAKRLEEQRRQHLLEEQRRQEQEKADAESRLRREQKQRFPEKTRPSRERPLPAFHTAKRGETLPLIAASPDVYNDPSLWPLLYRANRDQIKDPRHIWPGQVLRIPRNLSRDDINEARRYAQQRSIY
ncbi:hypothetical protein SAMN06269301_1233 [Geobacter sp. DSM 9736]|nr:hypothetical protein SAMN06269301_1233 [Geobacter sp. DSM 9736]